MIRNVHFLAISSRIQTVRFNNKKARRGHSHFQYGVTVVTDKSTVVTETVLLKILKIRGVINKDIIQHHCLMGHWSFQLFRGRVKRTISLAIIIIPDDGTKKTGIY